MRTNKSNNEGKVSGASLLLCWTKAEADAVSGEQPNRSISSVVRVPPSIASRNETSFGKESFLFLVKSFSGCLENIQDTSHSCSKDSSIFRFTIFILSNILQASL